MDPLVNEPDGCRALFVLAHGAGAGMRHPFMDAVSEVLGVRGVGTLRYEFPYMKNARRRPDAPRVLQDCVRDAVDEGAAVIARRGLRVPLVAGGKSMGGRMTSLAAADGGLSGVEGLVFLGFPLHAMGKRGIARADHLDRVDVPMLFVQGTRDGLADLELMRRVCDRIGQRATLHVVDGGDHSFNVLKRSGRQPEDVMREIAETVSGWLDTVTGRR